MDKLKKIGLTALGTVLVSSTAMAAELTVTGGANLVFDGADNGDDGNTWSNSDTMTFTGSADLDNGWTISQSQGLAGGSPDNRTLTIGMGDMGSLVFEQHDGAGPVADWDDMMPHANEESWSEVAGTVTAAAHGAGDANSNFEYSNSSMIDGVNLVLFYQPSHTASSVESSTEVGIQYTGIEGLEVGYAFGDNNDGGAGASIENSNLYLKYAMDAFTIGYQVNETDAEAANGDSDFTAYGVSYAVTDDMSVSYNVSKVEHDQSTESDQEATALGISYTSGGLTLAASMHEVDNVGGTSTTDNSGYEVVLSFAY